MSAIVYLTVMTTALVLLAAGSYILYLHLAKAQKFEENVNAYTMQRLDSLKNRIAQLPTPPSIALVQIGRDDNDTEYCESYVRRSAEVGAQTHWYGFEDTEEAEVLIDEIKEFNEHYDGVVIKLSHNTPISGAQAHSVLDREKNIMSLAPAAGIMNYLEDQEEVVHDVRIYSDRKDLILPIAAKAMKKYDNVKIQISPTEQRKRNYYGFSSDMVELLGFIESIENLLR